MKCLYKQPVKRKSSFKLTGSSSRKSSKKRGNSKKKSSRKGSKKLSLKETQQKRQLLCARKCQKPKHWIDFEEVSHALCF